MASGVQLVWTDIPATITQAGTNVPHSMEETISTTTIIQPTAWPGDVSWCPGTGSIPAGYIMASACFSDGEPNDYH
jgi:hypothetical protein